MQRLRLCRSVLLGFMVLACMGVLDRAQNIFGSIIGSVTDPGDAVLPGTSVIVTNLGTGEKRTVTTDGQGNYQVLSLSRGDYKVEVDAAGFKHFVRSPIDVSVAQEARVNEQITIGEQNQQAVGRPFDTALTAARMIFSAVFDKYPKLKVLFVHMGGALEPVVCRLDWNWELNYKGIQNPPIEKVAKNLRKPSDYFKSNIYVDTMGPSTSGLKTAIEMCGVDHILFGTDFGPVPINPKVHIDLVNDTITDAVDRDKIFSANTVALLHLPESAPHFSPRAA